MTTWTLACDASYDMPDPAQLGDVDVVMGYLSDTPGKGMTAAYVARCAAAGKKILPLYETTATMALAGRTGGIAAANTAIGIGRRLGLPGDVPIIYALDQDYTTAQMAGPVSAFVDGLHAVAGLDGEYGGYNQLGWLVAHKQDVGRLFQTYAWSGGRWLPATQAPIEQYRNGVKLAGGTVDLCRIDETQITLWNPGELMTAVDLTPAAQAALVDAIFNHQITDPGVNGTVHSVLAKTFVDAEGAKVTLAGLTPAAIGAAVVKLFPPVAASGLTIEQVGAAVHEELVAAAQTEAAALGAAPGAA